MSKTLDVTSCQRSHVSKHCVSIRQKEHLHVRQHGCMSLRARQQANLSATDPDRLKEHYLKFSSQTASNWENIRDMVLQMARYDTLEHTQGPKRSNLGASNKDRQCHAGGDREIGEKKNHFQKKSVKSVKAASHSAASTANVIPSDRFDSASSWQRRWRRRLSERVKTLIKESRQVQTLTEM